MVDAVMKSVLVVEDNPGLQKQLKWAFDGYLVHLAGDRASAIEQIERNRPAVVTLDLGLPPDPTNASEGLLLLDEILNIAPHTKVIVVTGNDDRDNALKAVSMGAYDFYRKPIDPDILALIVDRASRLYELEAENRRLLEGKSRSPLQGVIGASKGILAACRMVEKVAPTDVTVLVTGASGTGKELFSRALHDLSRRAGGPFIAINCAAIPDTLLESELFGYEKGAFTGAIRQVQGKIECANGGTLFLDEIGDMPLPLQAKLLRFLQERVIERLGGRKSIPVDVRILCATHHDLEKLIARGDFREDLFYRISEVVIDIPALCDREGDRILLARSFLSRYVAEEKRNITGFTQAALNAIDGYAWPGNVRELENRVKRAVVLAEGKQIDAADLGFAGDQPKRTLLDIRAAREAAEREVVEHALALYNRNISHAAEALGISRPSLYSLMRKLNIQDSSEQV